jgi:hypothetical protein
MQTNGDGASVKGLNADEEGAGRFLDLGFGFEGLVKQPGMNWLLVL